MRPCVFTHRYVASVCGDRKKRGVDLAAALASHGASCKTGKIWPATNMDASPSAGKLAPLPQSAPTAKRNQVVPAIPGSTVSSGGVSLPPPPLAPGMRPLAPHTSYTQNPPPMAPQMQMSSQPPASHLGGSSGGPNGERADVLPPLQGASGDGLTPRQPLPQVGVHQTPHRTANPEPGPSRRGSQAQTDYARLAEQKAMAVSNAQARQAAASAASAGAGSSRDPAHGRRKDSVVSQAAAGASKMLQRASTWVCDGASPLRRL